MTLANTVLPSIITATATTGVAAFTYIAAVRSKRGDLYEKVLVHLGHVERKQSEKGVNVANSALASIVSGIAITGIAVIAYAAAIRSKRRKLHRKLIRRSGCIRRKQPNWLDIPQLVRIFLACSSWCKSGPKVPISTLKRMN
jgi:hypothetical protein